MKQEKERKYFKKYLKKYLKKYRLFLPFGMYLLVQLLVLGVKNITDSVLRSIPQLFLSWFGILSALLLLFGVGKYFCEWGCKRQFRVFVIAKKIWYVLVGIFGVGMIATALFFSVFKYRPEQVVARHGVRMVGSVNSFLQEQVSYYEYKNFLFRGKEKIGQEDYGNGGTNPLKDENREPVSEDFEK